MQATELKFDVPGTEVPCTALLDHGPGASALLVIAHGAGAGMRHQFMEGIVERLVERCIATFRFQFPYWEQGRRRPDPQPLLLEAVRSAIATAHAQVPELPLFAGGKSMGGRMTTLAASEEPLEHVRGIVLFGFPLHRPGPPTIERAKHLSHVGPPLLFLQGTRDTLADLDSMREVVGSLGKQATMHVVEGADHSFHVLKRSGRSDDEVLDDMAAQVEAWVAAHAG